jgi:hypothetical protein
MMFVDGSTWNDVFRMASQAELLACGSRQASWYRVWLDRAVSTEMRHDAAGLLVYFLAVCPGLGQLGEFAA